jgi:acetolactate synthase-1/2/3 large subunit
MNNSKINSILRKTLKSSRPEFIEVMLKPDQKIIPKLQFGNPIEDLSPTLPREEFKNNMIVETVSRSKKIHEAN